MLRAYHRRIFRFLLAIIPFVCPRIYAQSPTAKVSTLQLEDYGWQPLPKPQRGSELPGSRSSLVSVDHNGRVLVGFTTRQNFSLATREHPGLSFHILRFTFAGKVDCSLDLPTKDYFTNGLYLGHKDQIIARANDVLQVFFDQNENGENCGTGDWQALASCPRDCHISRSISRRTLIIGEFKDTFGRSSPWPTNNSTYTILDTSFSPPRIIQTCRHMANYGEKITDRFAYWAGSEGHEPFTRRFPFCDIEHPQELPLGWERMDFPLNDETFLRLDPEYKKTPGAVTVIQSDGRLRFHHELPTNDTPVGYSGVTSDEQAIRIALTVSTWRGGSRLLDISGKRVGVRVAVYDETGHELASVPVSTTYRRDFDFALSPDGHRLAILDAGILTVVDLE